MTKISVASHSHPNKTYCVNLTLNCCDCPDFTHRRAAGCPQEGTDCKHLRQARKERFEHLAMIAGTLEDAELQRLIEKYAALPGKGAVVLALLAEQWDRWQIASPPVPQAAPEVAPKVAPHIAEIHRLATAPITDAELLRVFA